MSRPDRRRALALALTAVLAGLAAGSCGYSTGLRLGSPETTVGVEVFGNDGKLPDIELELHRELVDSMNRLVHADLVDARRADLVVRGRIVDYALRRGIRSGDNKRLESGLSVVVEVQLVRRLSGVVEPAPAVEDDGRRLSQREIERNTMPPTAADERVERGFTTGQEFGFVFQGGSFQDGPSVVEARQRLFANLADRIVLDLFGPLARRGKP